MCSTGLLLGLVLIRTVVGEWCSSTTQGVVSLKLYQTGRGLLQLDLMRTVTFGRAQECTSNLHYQNDFLLKRVLCPDITIRKIQT